MRKATKLLRTVGLPLLLSTMLSACGGSGSSDSTTTNGPSSPPGDSTPAEPQQPDTQVVGFNYQRQSAGQAFNGTHIQSAAFANGTGHFLVPVSGQSTSGNITVSVDVEDPDGIKAVLIGFGDATEALSLTSCQSDCPTTFHATRTGINPAKFGGEPGDQVLQLWVDDSSGNRDLVSTVSFNWQQVQVSGVNGSRQNNVLSMGWNNVTNYFRYNVYVASEPGVGPDNYKTLADGQAYLALKTPNIDLDNKQDTQTFYTMVTAVNGSGESAFSEPTTFYGLDNNDNQPPLALEDNFFVNEDGTLSDNVLGNDSDPESQPLRINLTPVVNVQNGTLTLQSNGNFDYVPRKDFSGRDSFVYQVIDSAGKTDTARVNITLNQSNDPPIQSFNRFNLNLTSPKGTGASAQAIELTVTPPGLLINYLDIDSSSVTLVTEPVDPPTQGTIELHEDGSFIYTPNANASGEDTFTYQSKDSDGALSEPALVTITFNASTQPPRAASDYYQLQQDQILNADNSDSGHLSILHNDTDEDDQSSLFVIDPIVKTPDNGVLSMNADGTFSYTPSDGFYGTDSFIYEISDGAGNIARAAATLVVSRNNSTPVAISDEYTLDEDSDLIVTAADGLLSNDTDADLDPLTVNTSVLTPPNHGSVTLSQDGSFSYTPDADFAGLDSFEYQISDDGGATASATVQLTIVNINDAPTAMEDTASTLENTPVNIDVLANDSDIENDPLTIIEASVDANQGSVAIESNNTLTYTPRSNFVGTAQISYRISDGNDGFASSTVAVIVGADNQPPVAVDDSYSVDEDTVLQVNAASGLPLLTDNDSDPDGDNLSVTPTPVTDVSHGTLVLTGSGNFMYTPNADFSGADSFRYEVVDNQGGSAIATVTLTVNPVNDLPVANDDTAVTAEETLMNINVLANDSDIDGDPLTVTSATAKIGSVSIETDNTLNYTPPLNFVGVDTIEYTINDGHQGTASATVTITVQNVNDAPVANDDSATTLQNTPVTVDVLANDTDVDGDTLEILSLTPFNGSAVVNQDNTVTFTPNGSFVGVAQVNYTISDQAGGTASAVLSIDVISNNSAPVAVDDSVSTLEDTAVVIDVLQNDSDPNSDTLTIDSAQADIGNTTILADNKIEYQPVPNFNGTATIVYTISDGNGGSASAKVTVTVEAVNDLPVAQNDSAETNAGNPVVINVLANDSDADGDTLTVTSAAAQHGAVAINSDNSLTYTPQVDFTGDDTIAYTITDPQGATASATVSVKVYQTNANPVANDDAATTQEDTLVNINVLANDSDVDSPTLTVVEATAENGEVLIKSNGTLDYTPKANFNGVDTINYKISDNELGSATAKVTVTVISVNDAPVAQDDSATTEEDKSVTVDVLANDSDVEDSVLAVTVIDATNGGALPNPDNSITFFPEENFSGEAVIHYSVADSGGLTANATLTVTVTPVNDIPVAQDDSATISEDSSAVIDILSNDSDADGDTLTFTVENIEHGTITATTASSVTFKPTADFSGTAGFGYTLSDGKGGTASAKVTIEVIAVNDAPVANTDEVSTKEDSENNINVLANDVDVDGDTLTVVSASASHGKVVIQSNQTLNYKPEADYNGNDVINYVISDGNGGSDSGLVNISIQAVNDAPVANDDSAVLDEDVSATIDVLANDSDVDTSDTLRIIAATSPHGTAGVVDVQTQPKLSFVPELNFNGDTTISYTIADKDCSSVETCGADHTATATVNVTITPVNDSPTVNDVTASVAENAVNGYTVATVSGSDVDDTDLHYSIISGNGDGVFAIGSTSGVITVSDKTLLNYEATQSYTLSVKVVDPSNAAAYAQVNIAVTPVAENESLIADSSFGNTGIDGLSASDAFAFDNQDTPMDAAIDSNGKIVVVGSVEGSDTDIAISRYLADGRLDLSFGIQGIFTKSLGGFDSAKAVAVDSSNNFYVAGETFDGTHIEYFVAKFLASGQLDTGFGSGGIVTSNLSASNLRVADILVHSSGALALAIGVDDQFSLYKLDAASGSSLGSTNIDMTGEYDVPTAIAEQSDGKIVMVGYTADAANLYNYDFAATRIDFTSLSLDSQFGTNGKTTFDLGQRADDMPMDVAITSAQNILLSGSTAVNTDITDVAIAVLTPSGTLNSDVGTNGISIIDADNDAGNGTNSSYASSARFDSNGNLYLGLQLGLGETALDFGVAKLTSSFTLDSAFGTNGVSRIDLASGRNEMAALMLDSSARPLVATSLPASRNQDVALARLTTTGALDTTFGNRGYTVVNHTASSDDLNDGIALTSSANSGKFVYTGSAQNDDSTTDLVVARYNSDGSLDTGFANSGYFRLADRTAGSLSGLSVAELSDGRLAVAGSAGDSGIVVLLDANGRLDTSFDSDGIKTFGGDSSGYYIGLSSVAVSDSQLVIAGYSMDYASDNIDIYLGKLNSDGSFDSNFGDGGVVMQDLGAQESIEDMALLSDGSIIVAGTRYANSQTPDNRALIAKFLPAGTLDTSGFAASSGYRLMDLDSSVSDNEDFLSGVTVASDGTIYAAGFTHNNTGANSVAVSLTADGNINSNFGTGGITSDISTSTSRAHDITLDGNGKPVLTGVKYDASNSFADVYIVRLTTSGVVDPLFNNGSAYSIDYNGSDSVSAIQVLSDGRIMIAGANQITGYSTKVWYLQVYRLVQ